MIKLRWLDIQYPPYPVEAIFMKGQMTGSFRVLQYKILWFKWKNVGVEYR